MGSNKKNLLSYPIGSDSLENSNTDIIFNYINKLSQLLPKILKDGKRTVA